MLAQFAGAQGVNTYSMTANGGVLFCTCIVALLCVVEFAAGISWAVSTCALLFIEMWHAILGKIDALFHMLGMFIMLNISAAIICAMARFQQWPAPRILAAILQTGVDASNRPATSP